MQSPKPRVRIRHLQAGVAGAALFAGLLGSSWWAQTHLDGAGLLPHGWCFTWVPGLLWLHVLSDSLIALAYLSIPLTLLSFVRRREDLPYSWMLLLFGSFIVACGMTHVMEVWTIWRPDYWFAGMLKAATATVSVATAVMLVRIAPRALALPSAAQLQGATAALQQEVAMRRAVEAELRLAQAALEQRVLERTAELQHTQALLDAVFTNAPVGLAVFDAENRFVRVNAALARINGLGAQAHVGRRLAEVAPGVAEAAAAQIEQVRATGRALIGSEISGHVDGTPMAPGEDAATDPEAHTWAVSYFPVQGLPGLPGTLVGAVCHDVTEQRRTQQERARLLQQAEDASRLKDEFIARVSHELRTPLQAIVTSVALLETGRLPPESTAPVVGRIKRNVQQQSRMIADLLDVSRMLSGKLHLEPALLDPFELTGQAVQTLLPSAQAKGVSLDFEPSGAGVIAADPARLDQVVVNLLSNAIQFTPTGGAVQVRCRLGGEFWELDVIDNGVGIAAEECAGLFEAFRQGSGRVRGERRGLGLGLAIARHILQQCGGDIRTESPGRGLGSTFRVRWPVGALDVVNDNAADAASGHGETALQGLRLLLVEDEPTSAEAMAQALRERGAQVDLAVDAAQAQAHLHQLPVGGWRALVTDLDLGPGEDGFAVLRAWRASSAQPGAALALSAYGSAQDLRRSAEAGFAQHLVKPVTPDALALALARLRLGAP